MHTLGACSGREKGSIQGQEFFSFQSCPLAMACLDCAQKIADTLNSGLDLMSGADGAAFNELFDEFLRQEEGCELPGSKQLIWYE